MPVEMTNETVRVTRTVGGRGGMNERRMTEIARTKTKREVVLRLVPAVQGGQEPEAEAVAGEGAVAEAGVEKEPGAGAVEERIRAGAAAEAGRAEAAAEAGRVGAAARGARAGAEAGEGAKAGAGAEEGKTGAEAGAEEGKTGAEAAAEDGKTGAEAGPEDGKTEAEAGAVVNAAAAEAVAAADKEKRVVILLSFDVAGCWMQDVEAKRAPVCCRADRAVAYENGTVFSFLF